MSPKTIFRLMLGAVFSAFPGLVSGNDAPDLCVVQLDIPKLEADLVEPNGSPVPERFMTEGMPFPFLENDGAVEGGGSITAVWTIGPDGAVHGPTTDFSLKVWGTTPTSNGRDTIMAIASLPPQNRETHLVSIEAGAKPEMIVIDAVPSPRDVTWSEVLGGYILSYSGGESGHEAKFGLLRNGRFQELGDGRPRFFVDVPDLEVVALYDAYRLLVIDRNLNVRRFDAPMLMMGEPSRRGFHATSDPGWLFIEMVPVSFLVNLIHAADDGEVRINRLLPLANEYHRRGAFDLVPNGQLARAVRQSGLDGDGCLVFSDALGRVLTCDGQTIIVAGRTLPTGMQDGAKYEGDLRGIGHALFRTVSGELWTIKDTSARQVNLPGPIQLASPRLAEAEHQDDVFFGYRAEDPLIAFDAQPDDTVTAISLMPETGGPFVPVASSPAGNGTVLATRTGLFITQDWKTTTQIWETPAGETIDTTGHTTPMPVGEDQILFATSTGGSWIRVSKFYLLGQCG